MDAVDIFVLELRKGEDRAVDFNLRGPEVNVWLLEKWRNPTFGEKVELLKLFLIMNCCETELSLFQKKLNDYFEY